MIMQVVAVRDRAANLFMRPFVVNHLGQAIRGFADEINRNAPDNQTMWQHPDDFDLYHIGTYSDEDGRINPCDPHMIATGKQLAQTRKGNGHA